MHRLTLLLACLLSISALAADLDVERQWPLNGRNFAETRFSPLKRIDTRNVGTLGLAWEFNEFLVRGRVHRGNESAPLFIDGVLYFSGPWSVVYAVDARSGALKWKYDPQVDGNWARRACCDAVNRGVAVWKGRVYVASLDGWLIALDAGRGTPLWKVDTFTDRRTMNYVSTGAPRIAGDNVVIGNSGAEMGARGYVSAYDLGSGKLAWRFFTVPGDPKQGPDESPDVTRARKTWSPQSRWDLGGGGTVWDSMVYEPELGLLYVGVGNGDPHPVWTRSPGGGDNLYLASIVALDARTGRLRWYYQTTPADSYDYTATQNMILAELPIGGRPRAVLMQAPKNGFFYVLDRATGELLSAKPYTRASWADHVDLKTGRPVLTAKADYSQGPQEIFPSQAGGHNWMPMSYGEDTGLVYIPALESGMEFGLVPGDQVKFEVGTNNEGDSVGWIRAKTDHGSPWSPPNPGPAGPPFHALLKAWDPVAGRVVWQSPAKPYWSGGTLATAGGLVFQGAADGTFSAYEARQGTLLKALDTGTAMLAAPIAYELDGVQYVAVLAGFGGAFNQIGYPAGSAPLKYQNSERLLVFKLGGGPVPMPPAPPARTSQPLPRATSSDPAVIARGESLIGRCAACHGFRGNPNGYPDLWNLPQGTHDLFKSIVYDGALSSNGMPAFKDVLSEQDVAAIQAFLIADATQLRAAKH